MFVLHGTQGMGNRYGDFRQVVWNPGLIEVINFFSVFGGGDNVSWNRNIVAFADLGTHSSA
jgi:hypothetical protein